jgi:membrane dipeptidase
MIRHIDYLVNRVGIDCVALGSDFDGATIPEEIGDAAGNQKLIAALRQAGYGAEELTKMASENWLRILAKAWREEDA